MRTDHVVALVLILLVVGILNWIGDPKDGPK
jgi:hypothetical protein